jgi:arylsulfatase A-like enzyme
MRILYLDIDSLRPDHLGCHGYHRATSPNIDCIAAAGVRHSACHASDVPCLPSRSALFSGQCGLRTGVINHGGVASQPFNQGPARGFRDRFGTHSWPALLRQAGHHTASISSFGERHSAWHWYAGFNEVINNGLGGNENADQPCADALSWLGRRGRSEDWFLHLNVWDPHTPYRVPAAFGDPFADSPAPTWLTEEIRQSHWRGGGSHSAQEILGYSDETPHHMRGKSFPRQPARADSMAAVKAMFDGYDTGVRYADEHLGRVFNQLADLGILDETVIVISADHGENLGELNIYGDHQTADYVTTHVPLIIKWPGVTDTQAGRLDHGLHYHFDFAATVAELAGATIPEDWDGRSFASDLRAGREGGRDHLVLSQAAWCCQRAVRTRDNFYIRTHDDAWHDFPGEMLFDIAADPHELRDLAPDRPELVADGRAKLAAWREAALARSPSRIDPMDTVLAEGGSLHAREGSDYPARLRATGRGELADRAVKKRAGLGSKID